MQLAPTLRLALALLGGTSALAAVDTAPPEAPAPAAGQEIARPIYIREFRVAGAHILPAVEVEETVYPYLGPGRTQEDIEQARAALEKVYKDKGYQTVSVEVPPQQGRGGIIVLQVTEGKVGRLRVKGSRYFSLDEIKKHAPSLAEGTVPNFNDVTRDIVKLNQLPDRRITPTLRPGEVPGTVDIDLTVKDTLPLHGSVELNNRYSANTTPLRLSGSASYNNLWQLGHSVGASFQISPQDLNEVEVFSGYYIARFPTIDWLSLMVQGTKQNSNVSTLGAVAVAGKGEILGARAMFTLPAGKDFYQSISVGMDYKHFAQDVTIGLTRTAAPTTYFPVSAAYSATWANKGAVTELNAGLTFHFRGMGSSELEFENSRFKSDGSFFYLRGDLSHTHDLPGGAQIMGKVEGQLADQPLLSSEQFGGGGLGTVRGYLEAEVLGDNAIAGTLELRSPSLLGKWSSDANDWRIYAFGDAALLTLNEPLPEQESRFHLASIGIGSRVRLFDHFNGSIDAAFPLIGQTETSAGNLLFTFRVWAEF